MALNAGLGRVVLASANAGKLREMQALLASTGIELIAQAALGVPDAPEPFTSRIPGCSASTCCWATGEPPSAMAPRYAVARSIWDREAAHAIERTGDPTGTASARSPAPTGPPGVT